MTSAISVQDFMKKMIVTYIKLNDDIMAAVVKKSLFNNQKI